MAYGEGSENGRMLLRTVRLTFDISGRSRRTEVVYWWFATAIASVVLGFIATTTLPWKAGLICGDLLRALSAIPMFSLLARRLHDQDRSGWWGLLLPLSIVFSLPEAARWIVDDPQDLLVYYEAESHSLRWVAAFTSLATLVLFLLPGTTGRNRYGDDPREGELPKALVEPRVRK